MHTVIAADPNGVPIRVACGYCSSEHNYRGGPRIAEPGRGCSPEIDAGAARAQSRAQRRAAASAPIGSRFPSSATAKGRASYGRDRRHLDLEMLLRRIIREEGGITPVAPAEKWRGGTLVLKPGNGLTGEELADRDVLPQDRHDP